MKKLLTIIMIAFAFSASAQSMALSQDISYVEGVDVYFKDSVSILSNLVTGESYYQVNGSIENFNVPSGWFYGVYSEFAPFTYKIKPGVLYQQVLVMPHGATFLKIADYSNQVQIW